MSDTANVVKRIPKFASEEEARDFWDTHSILDYLDETEDVTDNPPANLRRGPGRDWSKIPPIPKDGFLDVTVTLYDDEIAAAYAISYREQTPLFALFERWVREKLAQERDAAPGK